ncbi:MAG: SDR family NAD(P)-dependent oxidoreductase, partial [Polyangiales bacterium]
VPFFEQYGLVMNPDSPLDGRVALVTGASSGIGRAIVEALLDRGARVVLSARRRERLEAATVGRPSGQTMICPADLRREDDILEMFAAIRAAWGGVEILVNSGGLGRSAPLVDGATEDWREMLEVNVLGLSICTREALRDMRREDRGHIVHVSSMAAHRVPSGSGVYAGTKFAVRALTEGLRKELRELGSRIRVTALSPGFVETEFAEVYHGSASAAEHTYGRFKVLDAVDVASTVLHVLEAPPHVEIHDVLMRGTQQPT